MDQKVRSVSEVLTSLKELTGHYWHVEDTGGGCEVFYSESMNALIAIWASINFDRDAGGVFDSEADRMNWDYRVEIAEGLEDPFTVDPYVHAEWQLVIGGEGVNLWEEDRVTFSAMTLTEILNYLASGWTTLEKVGA